MKSKYFCSFSSRHSNDNIAGTASFFDKLLLIEYRGTFKNEAFDESNIPEENKIIIKKYIESNPNTKLLLIKKDIPSTDNKLTLYGAFTSNKNFYRKVKINSYAEINFDLLESLFESKSSVSNDSPMFLICTNGTKDKCCAKFGLPIWKDFRELDNNVWQCSHLGGDRFAPTALVLPSFSTYGHISTEDVDSIISFEINKKIYYKNLRGCAAYNFYEQAADIYIRKKNDFTNKDSVEIFSSHKVDNNVFEVKIKIKSSHKIIQLLVEKRANKHFDFITCNSIKKSYSFEYIISSI